MLCSLNHFWNKLGVNLSPFHVSTGSGLTLAGELSINSLFKKSQIQRSTCNKMSFKKLKGESCLYQLRHSAAQCSKFLHCKKQENEQVLSRCLSYSKVWYINHDFPVNDNLPANVREICAARNAKMNKYLPIRERFWPFALDD